MKLGLRIFLCSLVIFAGCVYFPVDWMWSTLRTRYLEGVEEPLVDTANLLASVVEEDMARPGFDAATLRAPFDRAHTRALTAQIYDLQKSAVDLQLYITDAAGTVVFDTREPSAVGEDYSDWRDVKLTLAGQYGARTTRNENDPLSSVLYVAAPLYQGDRIAGVLTVAKPTASIQSFLRLARPAILQAGLLSLGVAALLSLAVSYWLTRPLGRLARYADAIREGRRPAFPNLGRTEIADLGLALRRMQEALEGRRYAEKYVQTLTHELKSPLSAIRAAAELLHDGMPPAQQARFVANIRTETERISRIVERMLELATLENRREKPEMGPVDLAALVNTVVESQEPQLAAKGLQVEIQVPERLTLTGNAFLLHQALANLLQNAIDFSPTDGRLQVEASANPDRVTIAVTDEGPGVPEYAQSKIFERFYSLARPGTGKKSTGLGLNLVREVAQLHDGTIQLVNRPQGGAIAELVLPRGLG
jgi:two-component system, OmpR family, sensor histidine kinase CreC